MYVFDKWKIWVKHNNLGRFWSEILGPLVVVKTSVNPYIDLTPSSALATTKYSIYLGRDILFLSSPYKPLVHY